MGLPAPLLPLALLGLAQAAPLHLQALAEKEPAIERVFLAEKNGHLELRLEVEPSYWRDHELAPEVEGFVELAHGALLVLLPEHERIDLLVRPVGGRWQIPPRHQVELDPPPKLASVVPDPLRFPYGTALAGKTIAISPGHGYIYYASLNGYSTQRANTKWNGCGDCRGIVEDFGTHEIAVQHLIPLLEGAGARVVLVRDRSYAAEGTAIDTDSSAYRESSGAFMDGANEGGFGGGYRFSSSADARATYFLDAAVSGPQQLSLWFVEGNNRLADALVEISAPGGIRRHRLDQRTLGRRFVPIDVLDLDLGASIEVTLAASGASGVLITDLVRLGAGRHSSGNAWWSMGAEPFATYQQAPAAVRQYGDVSIRPVYAEWYGADAYVSIHSNASGQPSSTAAGTVTYRFNCLQYADHSNDPPAASCDDPAGSDRLQALVHEEMITLVKRDWDPNWVDRGTKVANFGELRELGVIPGILIETAFHDNVQLAAGSPLRATDNQALHDPRLRRALAEGVYRGLTRFLVGDGPYSLPAPTALVARRIDPVTVELDFPPVSGARGYRVYQAVGQRNFDQGRVVEQLPYRASGLVPDVPVFFKVASLNEAGEGVPSRVVGAKPSSRRAQVLLLDAFQREDAWVQTRDNRMDTALVHGLALAEAPFAFDGADESAWAAGRVNLAGYDALVLAFGRESTEHEILTPALREEVRTFAAAGGAVFADGSEIGWALDDRGDATSRAFLQEVFGVRLAKDDAAATQVRSAPGGLFASILPTPATLDDGRGGGLQTFSSDAFALESGAVAQLHYGGEADVAAASFGPNLVLGVALDSLVGVEPRRALLGGWALAHLESIPVIPHDGGVAERDGGAGPDGGEIDAGLQPDAGSPVEVDGGEPVVDAGSTPAKIELYATGPNPIAGGCLAIAGGETVHALWLLLGLMFLGRLRRAPTGTQSRGRSGSAASSGPRGPTSS